MKNACLLICLSLLSPLTTCPSFAGEQPSPSTRSEVKDNLAKDTKEDKSAADRCIVAFTPPKGWKLVDASTLPPHVQAMVVGCGKSEFPPSMNLSMEKFTGSVKDYLEIVKQINASQGSEWKELGTIKTEAGEASISQAESLTEWGKVRMMHVILSKNEMIYILTASALKEEFPEFYKTFFLSLRSLRIQPDLASAEDQTCLKTAQEKTTPQPSQRLLTRTAKASGKPDSNLK